VGLQWGDEGKGKVVDFVCERFDAVARVQGGPNAGHTVVIGDRKFKMNHVPSGILRGKESLICTGTVVNPEKLVAELEALKAGGLDVTKVKVSGRAHVIMPYHLALDTALESARGAKSIGTTRRGIGPCYADRAGRDGIRVWDLLDEVRLAKRVEAACLLKAPLLKALGSTEIAAADPRVIVPRYAAFGKTLAPHVADTEARIDELARKKKRILFEGAHGILLDVDHGTYPYVTSSTTVPATAAGASGLPHRLLGPVIGVVKAFQTRVGAGPFPTELEGALADEIRSKGGEFGTATGRPRRVGWLDLVALRTAVRQTGAEHIALTKADVLAGLREVKVCTDYDLGGSKLRTLPSDAERNWDARPVYRTFKGWPLPSPGAAYPKFPPEFRAYVEFVESQVKARIVLISLGPERTRTVVRGDLASLTG
jgi:adenylosuccinate synthase